MFNVTKVEPNRIDIELSGKMDSEEMRTALDELEEKSQGIEQGRMLYDIIEFNMPSFEAIAIEFSRLPALFGLIRKFDKVAVLSDTNWIQRASEFEGLLIPGLQIKAFNRDQKEAALAWLSEG